MDARAPVALDVSGPIWDRVFTVAPLVLVGTLDDDGVADFAPKHMALPLGWTNLFGFVCSPRHGTQRNAVARGVFTVSYPTPDQVVLAGLAATSREADASKPALRALPTTPARSVEGVLVDGAALHLECELERVIEGFGDNTLVVGRIVAAAADERALRAHDRDDADTVRDAPLLAYVSPGRYATIDETNAFPYPADFSV